MSFSLEQKIANKQILKFTQDLQQSVKILQFSTTELVEYIGLQLEQNPFLTEHSEDILDAEEYDEFSNNDGEEEFEVQEGNIVSKDDLYYSDLPTNSGVSSTINSYNNWQNDYQDLTNNLTKQITLEFSDIAEQKIALYLADLLNENGYIHYDQAELLETLGINLNKLESIIKRLQKLEPTGIFARDLAECLTLQLQEQNKFDQVYKIILSNLELLQHGELVKLSKLCSLEQNKFYEYIKHLKTLNPRPGNDLSSEKQLTVNPDVIISKNGGLWSVELNWDILPKIRTNTEYYGQIKKITKNSEDRNFLSEHFYQANWLVKSLKTRAETLLKVSKKIVELQQDFFNKGKGFLKPMILANIASALGINNSTVSRIINNKYMLTPHGCFELKYFFSSALDNLSNFDTTSSSNVKNLIRHLIAQENIGSILSDEQIVQKLRGHNINIARRTVNKYREELNIPGSSTRKSIKALTSIK